MKKIISFLLVLILICATSSIAYAENTETCVNEASTVSTIRPGNSPRAEETVWIQRTTESGLIQKRLWSITYRVWLTDWITVGYVDP